MKIRLKFTNPLLDFPLDFVESLRLGKAGERIGHYIKTFGNDEVFHFGVKEIEILEVY